MKRLQLWATLGIGAVALGFAACDKMPGWGSSSVSSGTDKTTEKTEVNLGAPLFPPEDTPKQSKPASSTAHADPIVVHAAQITIPYTENVPTKNNGTVWQVCTEIKPGEEASIPQSDRWISPTTKKVYRILHEGQRVNAGDLVALLDDQVARAKYNAAVTDKKASDEMLAAAATVVDTAKHNYDIYMELQQGVLRPGSKVELLKAEQDWATAVKQAADTKGARDKNVESVNIADVTLKEHELRTSISGFIKTIYTHPGESIKELSPVMLIQNLDTLRIEGLIGTQYLPWLQNARGKTVFIEPAAQLSPQLELVGHMSQVTGVAVSKDLKKPLIVTVSEDKTACVWDRTSKFQKYVYTGDTPLRSVACTGPKANANLAVFGGDDGQVQILNLDKLGDEDAARKLKPLHHGKVTAVAFTPDGAFCATADDKEIIVWNVEKGEQLYKFNANHRGPITSLQITPQCKLVSIARDRTLRVWDLCEKGAKLHHVIDNRSGNVDVLAVSADGQRVIFDQERALQVRGLFDGRSEGIMNAPSDSTQFTGFAIFSPDSSLVVAGGTGDNPLSVFRTSNMIGGIAHLRARLAVGTSQPSCGAMSDGPDSFLVVGTTDHRVLVFARPPKADVEKKFPATITFLDPSVDSTERKVRIWAELPNPGMPMLPGDTVEMIVPQQ